MKQNRFDVRNESGADSAELLIYGIVGDWWDNLEAKDVVEAIRAISAKNIVVHIFSQGGSVFAGLAIHNALKDHSASITVHIDSLAASIASVIAMAGDTVIMPENAFLMIHNPYVYAVGDAGELRETADVLDKMKTALITAYTAKTGLSSDKISEMMDAETWLLAEEAVELGFADKATGTVNAQDCATQEFFNQLRPLSKVPTQLRQLMDPANKRPENQPQAKEKSMKITLQLIRDEHPDIVKALYDEGHAAGVQLSAEQARSEGADSERQRIQDVLAQSMPGHEELVQNLAFDGKTTGPEAAVQVLNAEKGIRNQARADAAADAIAPVDQPDPADDPQANQDPGPMTEEKAKAEFEKSQDLQDEFVEFENYWAYIKDDPQFKVRNQKR